MVEATVTKLRHSDTPKAPDSGRFRIPTAMFTTSNWKPPWPTRPPKP